MHRMYRILLARSFAKLMFTGKYKAALDLLNNSKKNAILHLDDQVDPSDPQLYECQGDVN